MNHTRLAVHCARLAARYRLRSAAMALGSFIGVAALTIVISVGQGATQKITKTVHQLFGGSSIIIVAGGSQFFGGPRADTARLTIDDIQSIASDVPGIATWDPQLVKPGATIRHGDRTATARVLGQSERSRVVWNRDVSRGDYFDAQDVASSARVALIGESFAASCSAATIQSGRISSWIDLVSCGRRARSLWYGHSRDGSRQRARRARHGAPAARHERGHDRPSEAAGGRSIRACRPPLRPSPVSFVPGTRCLMVAPTTSR